MKQGPFTYIMIGVLALVVSLLSSNKIIKEQTFKARRQSLSIKNSQPKRKDERKPKFMSFDRHRLGVLGVKRP